MKRALLFTALLTCSALLQAQPQLTAPCDTTWYEQQEFEWHITPRYDYSQTLLGKFFLSQAHYDQRFKLRDNGKQTVYMNCAEALEAIKAMDAISLGLPKVIYLVGWQYNGHDSKYPAFFECNESIKAPGDESAHESILKLMQEAKQYNTAVSFHINMYDCYDDSPLFEKYKADDVLARYEDGDYIHSDWGWCVSYARDWATGNAQARLDSLCKIFPVAESGTLHIDAFHSRNPVPVVEGDEINIQYISPISPYHGISKAEEIAAQLNIIRYLDAKGIDVTSEYCPEYDFLGYLPAVWHKNDSEYYMLWTERQLAHTNGVPWGGVFGRNVNCEQVYRNGADTMEGKHEVFKREFCLKSVPYLYLSKLTPVAYIKGAEDENEGIFSDDVRTFTDGSGENFRMYKGDVKLADGGDIFIPAGWVGDNVVVAYSTEGYDKVTWTLPSEIKAKGSAKAFFIDAEGEHSAGAVKVRGRKVTLSLKPGEMLELKF